MEMTVNEYAIMRSLIAHLWACHLNAFNCELYFVLGHNVVLLCIIQYVTTKTNKQVFRNGRVLYNSALRYTFSPWERPSNVLFCSVDIYYEHQCEIILNFLKLWVVLLGWNTTKEKCMPFKINIERCNIERWYSFHQTFKIVVHKIHRKASCWRIVLYSFYLYNFFWNFNHIGYASFSFYVEGKSSYVINLYKYNISSAVESRLL